MSAAAEVSGTILIVDDEPWNVDLLEQELGAAGYRTVGATSGEEALAAAARFPPDLILLDVLMKGIDGYETCRRLKQDAILRAVPVIFLTALQETFEKTRAFREGAVDYVTKPFESEELLARVGVHVALRREIEAHRKSKATIRLLTDETRDDGAAMIGDSPSLRRVHERIAQVAPTDSTVLIQGETGTGKELVARAIHARSTRRDRPLIRLNCAALPRELVESELFGHERARSPERCSNVADVSSSPMAGRCSWTRWAICRPRRRPSCCASCRSASSSVSAGPARCGSTCA